MNQNELPLYEAMLKHKNHSKFSFHVPGHKGGEFFHSQAKDSFSSLLPFDLTELRGLDDLHSPSEAIFRAQALTASFYGVDNSFFLVNGSTVGNLAMILATCNEGDVVLVQRNCHKSILHALKLVNAKPIFLEPFFDEDFSIATCLVEDDVINIIKNFTYAKAMIITNPNYYGHTVTLDKIVSEAHAHNIAVLVDEAHGAHLGHPSPLLPKSAISSGADVVVQSAHKTLPAMTMSSFLHHRGELVDVEKVSYYLQMLQSSSPSYPLMLSLDLARHYLSQLTDDDIFEICEDIRCFRSLLEKIPQVRVVESSRFKIDPLKVTLHTQCHLTGFEIQRKLEEEGIFVELADEKNILLVMPLARFKDAEVVSDIVQRKLKSVPLLKKTTTIYNNFISREKVTTLAMSFKEMDKQESEIEVFMDCTGRIIAENIIPYPPGVPLFIKGELITETKLTQLKFLVQAGTYFQGGRDYLKTGLKVFKKVSEE